MSGLSHHVLVIGLIASPHLRSFTRLRRLQMRQKLKFREKLVGKGLTTDALTRKLKELYTELCDLDQEQVELTSLATVRKDLISPSILLHKDRGVKAFAACCLADILRLYAPDAPYTPAELEDIFQFIFRQLITGLKSPDAPYFNEYFFILESLSTVKSVVIVCDLPHTEDLILEILRGCFAMARRDLSKKIDIFMSEILVALIDEAHTLTTEVIETILSQFLESRQDQLQSGGTAGWQAAFQLATRICSETSAKLQRYISSYFSESILAHSPSHPEDLNDEEDAGEKDFAEIKKTHRLIKRLHTACPKLLESVIPQLEEEMRAQEVQIRIIVTDIFGEMLTDKGGVDLVKNFPTTWNVWLARKNDRAVPVRVKFVEACRKLLTSPVHEIDVAIEGECMYNGCLPKVRD